MSREDVQSVAPALEHYATDTVANGLWQRPGLAPRDRSIITVATVIARNQTVLLPEQLQLALDNGVKPAEISEIITHLAFYGGCPRCRGPERHLGGRRQRRMQPDRCYPVTGRSAAAAGCRTSAPRPPG
ncbi:carboxymuconolactone decarboxylase family protein [Pontibaca methylaminivorans]|uniref:carboxymuconolactone decarboxylase family protein n=1 Tax=Pontibaca methylaminivorans TaxID=515897 RepID=UPI000A0685E7